MEFVIFHIEPLPDNRIFALASREDKTLWHMVTHLNSDGQFEFKAEDWQEVGKPPVINKGNVPSERQPPKINQPSFL